MSSRRRADVPDRTARGLFTTGLSIGAGTCALVATLALALTASMQTNPPPTAAPGSAARTSVGEPTADPIGTAGARTELELATSDPGPRGRVSAPPVDTRAQAGVLPADPAPSVQPDQTSQPHRTQQPDQTQPDPQRHGTRQAAVAAPAPEAARQPARQPARPTGPDPTTKPTSTPTSPGTPPASEPESSPDDRTAPGDRPGDHPDDHAGDRPGDQPGSDPTGDGRGRLGSALLGLLDALLRDLTGG